MKEPGARLGIDSAALEKRKDFMRMLRKYVSQDEPEERQVVTEWQLCPLAGRSGHAHK